MTPKLSDELRQALSQLPVDQPLRVEDDATHTPYVLIRMDVFERMQGIVYDDGDPDPREFYPSFLAAVGEDIDAPGMELYNDYQQES